MYEDRIQAVWNTFGEAWLTQSFLILIEVALALSVMSSVSLNVPVCIKTMALTRCTRDNAVGGMTRVSSSGNLHFVLLNQIRRKSHSSQSLFSLAR